MAEVEWIKIVTAFFDDDKITLIENTPEADMVLIIWIKLLCLAWKKNRAGYIFLTEKIPYTDEMLATVFNRPLNTVRLALATFKKLEMINMDAAGVIKITNWEKHQNIEGMERIREGNRIRQQRYKGQHLLENGENICPYCGEKNKLTIDHIIPTSKGGKDNNDNKILCCLKCNMSKTNRDLGDFLNDKISFNDPININAITHNKKLMKYLKYDNNRFTGVSITPNNTIEEDKKKIREDKIKEIVKVRQLIAASLGEKPKENDPLEFDFEEKCWWGLYDWRIKKYQGSFPRLTINYLFNDKWKNKFLDDPVKYQKMLKDQYNDNWENMIWAWLQQENKNNKIPI